jgi:hypothetical protein
MKGVNSILRFFCILLVLLVFTFVTSGQVPTQIIKGFVLDRETKMPLPGANVIILNSLPLIGTSADSAGKYSLKTQVGRVTLKATYTGYEDFVVNDLLIGSGKEIDLPFEMRELAVSKKEIVVTANSNSRHAINQMAIISTQSIRTDDALRFAGGYYDPSRIVNSFAGVTTANNDESNDIVIRGNSSRGLLWRLEGIEIPNPNHFGDGQGGSGGAYSAISTNVISNFDFFTGAFPAEYGNAVSGVMDLNLRKGNSDNYEFAFQTGMIGAEIAAEGPVNNKTRSSFLVNARYVNFGYLSKLNLIDLGSTNWAPRSKDLVVNINLPSKRNASYNIFGIYGNSELGQHAVHDKNSWLTDNDRWEEIQEQSVSVLGLKRLMPLQGGDGFLRSVVAFTNFTDRYSEGYVDSTYTRTDSYHHSYSYPSLKLSSLLNYKMSPGTVLRTGLTIQFLYAQMEQWRRGSNGSTLPLVAPSGFGILYEYYAQLKNRISETFEINSGMHVLIFGLNHEINFEPRLGFKWEALPGKSFIEGVGLHSRIESFNVYYNSLRSASGKMQPLNKDLGLTKSFQLVAGIDLVLTRNIRLKTEAYYQRLFDVPVIDNTSSTYSALNTAEELPSSVLTNNGLGYNRGIEVTLEKLFSKNYYFLFTASLFKSKYRPGDMNWYNTYYNTGYVSNFLTGKDFYFGKDKRNSIGFNVKSLFRGGYRYTPVDIVRSKKANRIIYDNAKTYGAQFPGFVRIDGGINFRKNNHGYSWIIMLDVQNITDRKNIFRKRFNFVNGQVVSENVYSLGAVPVFNFRIEF